MPIALAIGHMISCVNQNSGFGSVSNLERDSQQEARKHRDAVR